MQAVSGCAPQLCVVFPGGRFLFQLISLYNELSVVQRLMQTTLVSLVTEVLHPTSYIILLWLFSSQSDCVRVRMCDCIRIESYFLVQTNESL